MTFFSPSLFLQTVVRDEWEIDANPDAPWRPQFNKCPVCSMEFSLIGDFDQIGEDLAYFFLKNGLENKLNKYLHEGKQGNYVGKGK